MDSEEKLKIVWIEMGEHCIMKCKKCGKEIICTGLKVPRKCDECGTEFKMNIHNKGLLIYLIGSIGIMFLSILVLKQFCNVKWVLTLVLIVEIVIVPNYLERWLYKRGLMKYKNITT